MASSAPDFVVAYDASCGPCSGFRAIVGFLDVRRRIRFVPLDVADESGLLAGISPALRHASFHLIGSSSRADGGVTERSGSEAVLPLVRLLSPWGRGVSKAVETLPGGVAAVAFGYSALSRLHRGCPPRPDGRRPNHATGLRASRGNIG